jgi:RNA polymerase sigma-70 factor, ECF subfamily
LRQSYLMKDDRHNIIDEDAALVASWRSGEISSFEALVRKYQKRMLNIAFRITDDYEDACEVTQDAFVAAYKGLDAFRGAARFSTWLTSITLNLSRNRRQQGQAKRRHEVYSSAGSSDGEYCSLASERPSPGPSALEQLERGVVHERLLQCIKALSDDFREVIVLRDMQDFSYGEICAILNIREGTVKSRIFRARDMVKECLKSGLGDI